MTFENTSYEALMREYLDYAPEGIDTRQGSIYYDAGSGFLYMLGRFYADLEYLYEMISLMSATGEYLDSHGLDYGVGERHAAVGARYLYTFDGTAPAVDDRFFVDGRFFVIEEDGDVLYLAAEEAGDGANDIAQGTSLTAVETITGLNRICIGGQNRRGEPEESDGDYRERIREKLSGPAENGNKQHYKTWCESFDCAARIIPLDGGVNTVTGVILGRDGKAADSALVEKIQAYIDPNHNGNGSGAANIGAVFTAIAPEAVDVSISFTAALSDEAKAGVRTVLENYFTQSNLEADGSGAYSITATRAGAEMIMSDYVNDYSDFVLSAGGQPAQSIDISAKQYARLAGLVINAKG